MWTTLWKMWKTLVQSRFARALPKNLGCISRRITGVEKRGRRPRGRRPTQRRFGAPGRRAPRIPPPRHPERSEGSVSPVFLRVVRGREKRILRLCLRTTCFKGGAVARRGRVWEAAPHNCVAPVPVISASDFFPQALGDDLSHLHARGARLGLVVAKSAPFKMPCRAFLTPLPCSSSRSTTHFVGLVLRKGRGNGCFGFASE